jgi:hypothetical protein
MVAQLELIGGMNRGQGCNFSKSSYSDTWFVNLRVTDDQSFPFVECKDCLKQTCYRRIHAK